MVMVPKTQTLEQELLWGKDAESSFRCMWISTGMSKSGTQGWRKGMTLLTPAEHSSEASGGYAPILGSEAHLMVCAHTEKALTRIKCLPCTRSSQGPQMHISTNLHSNPSRSLPPF